MASPFVELDLQDFQWLMTINFWGTVFGCKFFLPHLAAADSAAIVNILSDFTLIGFPTKTCYSASKFARLFPVLSNSLIGRMRERVPFV